MKLSERQKSAKLPLAMFMLSALVLLALSGCGGQEASMQSAVVASPTPLPQPISTYASGKAFAPLYCAHPMTLTPTIGSTPSLMVAARIAPSYEQIRGKVVPGSVESWEFREQLKGMRAVGWTGWVVNDTCYGSGVLEIIEVDVDSVSSAEGQHVSPNVSLAFTAPLSERKLEAGQRVRFSGTIAYVADTAQIDLNDPVLSLLP